MTGMDLVARNILETLPNKAAIDPGVAKELGVKYNDVSLGFNKVERTKSFPIVLDVLDSVILGYNYLLYNQDLIYKTPDGEYVPAVNLLSYIRNLPGAATLKKKEQTIALVEALLKDVEIKIDNKVTFDKKTISAKDSTINISGYGSRAGYIEDLAGIFLEDVHGISDAMFASINEYSLRYMHKSIHDTVQICKQFKGIGMFRAFGLIGMKLPSVYDNYLRYGMPFIYSDGSFWVMSKTSDSVLKVSPEIMAVLVKGDLLRTLVEEKGVFYIGPDKIKYERFLGV